MLKERVRDYFLNQDFNCAETTLRIINDEYSLGLQEQDFKLVSGFGAGCGSGIICGALAGAIAALGAMTVKQRAHEDPNFKLLCGEYCAAFEKALGSTNCADLRPRYFREDIRCAEAIEAAADCFEAFVREHDLSR